jgi:hypothetical protein
MRAHIDDRIIPAKRTPGGCLDIEVSVDAAAVSILAPSSETASAQHAASIARDANARSRLLTGVL